MRDLAPKMPAPSSELGVVAVHGSGELANPNQQVVSNWVTRVDPETGALLWQRWPSPISPFDGISAKTLFVDDAAGVLAGLTTTSFGGSSGIQQFGLDGSTLGGYAIALPQTRLIADMVLDPAANLALVYNENTAAPDDPSFCDRRTSADVVLSSVTHEAEFATGVATDSASNIFAVAVGVDATGVLYQINLAGDEVWTEEVEELYLDVKVDAQDAIVVAGRSADGTMGMIRKYGACA